MDDKNNKLLKRFIEQIQNLEKEDTQKSVSDIAEGSKSDEDEKPIKNTREIKRLEIENQRAEEDIKERQSFREEREKYAIKTFRFLWIYISTVIVIVVAGPVVASYYGKDFLESIPLAILIGTIPASMALFGWVLKGLFPMDKNK